MSLSDHLTGTTTGDSRLSECFSKVICVTPTIGYEMVVPDVALSLWEKFYDIDDVMLTSECFVDLESREP